MRRLRRRARSDYSRPLRLRPRRFQWRRSAILARMGYGRKPAGRGRPHSRLFTPEGRRPGYRRATMRTTLLVRAGLLTALILLVTSQVRAADDEAALRKKALA